MKKLQRHLVEGEDVFVGLEDSKRSWKVCSRSKGVIVDQSSMPAQYDNLKKYLSSRFPKCTIKLIYEAGFSGFWLYDLLKEDGIECIVTPPNRVTEQKDNKVKTDKVDARRLAKVLEAGDYVVCHVPSKRRREHRQLSRTLIQVQRSVTATKNQIRKFLDFHGINQDFRPGHWENSDYKNLRSLELSAPLRFCMNMYLDWLDGFLSCKAELQKKLLGLAQRYPYKRIADRLATAPGVGPLSAVRLTLEWGTDLTRFPTAKHFASYTGLTCSEYSTGDTIRKGRITAQSNRYVRAWLIQCAWRGYSKDPVLFKKFGAVRFNSGSKKKAIVAVARKLAVRLRQIAIAKEPYQLGVIQ